MNLVRTTLYALAALALPLAARAETTKTAASESKSVAKIKWQSDLKKALRMAEEEKKPVVILFTNPSWCHYCVELEKTHLASKEFKAWTADKAVFVKLDKYPMGAPSTAEEKKTSVLAKKYSVSGIPHWVSVDAQGNRIGEAGNFQTKSETDYLATLERSLNLDSVAVKKTTTPAAK